MPPGANMDDWCTLFRSGMWRLNYKLSTEGKRRFFGEFLPLLHDTKAEVMGARDDDSWYLVYIGTKVESRGKGYARKLIEHVTKTVSSCFTSPTNLPRAFQASAKFSRVRQTPLGCHVLSQSSMAVVPFH